MKRIVFGICIVTLVFSVGTQAQAPGPPGPEQKKLEVWAGTWTIQGEAKDSPSGPTHKTDNWTLQGEWLPGGFFLLIHGNYGEYRWLEVLGYDPSKKTYVGYVFHYGGNFEIYTFTFIDGTLFERGEGWRHEWHFSPDGLSATVKREIETSGQWWTAIEAKGVKSLTK